MVNAAPGIHFTLQNDGPTGIPVFARLLEPADRDALKWGFQRLSPQSRRFRFLGPVKALTDSQLLYLTENDNIERLAWAAADMRYGEHYGIGLARYVKEPEREGMAEFAVTVVDDYQHLGLGNRLLDLLIGSAVKNGFRVLRGYVSCDNTCMLKLLSRRCAVLKPAWGRVLEASLQVSPDAGPCPDGDTPVHP